MSLNGLNVGRNVENGTATASRRDGPQSLLISTAISKSQESVTSTPSSRPKLLIVDDSPTALVFLEAIFKGANYDVETAASGQEGLAKAMQRVPDLVITDGIMPDVDGFELIRQLREHPPAAHIPVVMLTSGDFRDAEYADRQPQPDAYVAKSMQIDPLMKQVTALLARKPR
jgi:DNA-binding response OmpR family regulator